MEIELEMRKEKEERGREKEDKERGKERGERERQTVLVGGPQVMSRRC